ncbi:NAD(P)-binding protein [Teratosphaeria destructans]|uniref:NAD(P)-binding protein n=1 Tax=Teratosphaeria destructans TaxID=418781 RepID=A0A9W7SK64_9PEZI|nr:NAD(P)-binding protein [Teratosphaeria destructans]
MPPTSWLIVGASRGIGHEFVRQLLARGGQVYATVRNREAKHDIAYWTENLVARTNLKTYDCNVLSEDSINGFVAKLKQDTPDLQLDCVVINAGVLKYPNRASEVSYDDLAFHMHTNTIGPIITAQCLLAAKIPIGTLTFISSDSGSTGRFLENEDGFAAYGASKAALNQMARHMAAELKRKGNSTTVICLHPGEVKTDMANIEGLGWEIQGQMTPEESVTQCIVTIESKERTDSGTFWTWENKPYPW